MKLFLTNLFFALMLMIVAPSASIAAKASTAVDSSMVNKTMKVAALNKNAKGKSGKPRWRTRTKPVKPNRPLPIVSLKAKYTQAFRKAHRRSFDRALSRYKRRFKKTLSGGGRYLLVQFPNGERRVMQTSRKHRKRKAKKSVKPVVSDLTSTASSVLTRQPIGAGGPGNGAQPQKISAQSPRLVVKAPQRTRAQPSGRRRGPTQAGRTRTIKTSGNRVRNFKSNAQKR